MFVVFVYVHVKPDCIDAFRKESEKNALESRKEPGVIRFDVLQQLDDPTRFVLYEAYRDEDGAKAHKETPHYAQWRDAVAPMMAEPRYSVKYNFCVKIN
ncbi:MAG TPA: putative quinol monooxygenase [Candidatus Hydrogenedens sp.]|nr:antibiotic biosynthesis monooxygenase [Candidatus Hydrogenedens sp.]HOK09957.1 putative quinol monooxygenase [Candidatus Hydrogenedens sp.]HOL19708.1 putative quinol monooxygenase [Candidatus Hydrogenedens sp.]HPP59952.1 putative quinol monooxygenase [Candidatus Hydrogenedens sp.]